MKSNTLYHPPLQHAFRPLAVIVLAVCSWTEVSLAQDPVAPGTPAPGAGTPAVPAATDTTIPGTAKDPAKPAADTTTPPTTAPVDKPSSPFRTGESTRTPGAAKKSPFAFDTGETDVQPKKGARSITDRSAEPENPDARAGGSEGNESRFVAPGFYGRGPQVVTPGQGQFARPKYRFGVSVGIGYDDNPDQATNANLGAVARPRKGTGFTYVNGHFDAQWLKPRTVFTVSLEAGGNFYFDRPGNSADGNARLALFYVNKLNPRSQFSANATFAYLSQPDYANQFSSTSSVAGDYFTGSTKFDFSYRWAPRFSTVTSASVNLLKYANESPTQLSNSYWNFIFGNEFRFIVSPRVTLVAEVRYGIDQYFNNSSLNDQTIYALGGVDWVVSRRANASLRAGASIRSFDSGGTNTAPYAEASLTYQTSRHSTLTTNMRYGFEQSSAAGDENLSYRFGLIYQQAFTSRFSGTAGFNFIHTNYNSRTGAKSTTDVYDLNLGLNYRFDRHFSIGTRYTYTLQDTSTGSQNFDRNRILFTAAYEY